MMMTAPLRRKKRLLARMTILVCAVAVLVALGACKKKEPAILTKPLDQLGEADMIAAATALGWGDRPSATHSKGLDETIIVSGDKEDPEGTDSPDGKKRLRFAIGLYMETQQTLASQKQSLLERGAAIEVSGNRILTAEYTSAKGPNQAEAKKILDRLLGR